MTEISKGTDNSSVKAQNSILDIFNWGCVWTCNKWSEEACDFVRNRMGMHKVEGVNGLLLAKYATPDVGIDVIEGNILVNAGIARLEDQLIGATTSPYNNSNARIGVGNSSTAVTASDTDLNAASGSSNRQFVTMDATFPSRSSQTFTFSATHTSGLSNFHWLEWGIDIGTTNGTTVVTPLLNHKQEDLGTKTTGSWQIQGAITIS